MKAPSVLVFLCLTSLAVLAVLAGQSAWAQQVWRCGQAANSYSDKACAQGQQLQLADPRSADEVASAQQQVRRQQALADQMAQQRQAEELSLQRQSAVAANLGPSLGMPKQKFRATKKRNSTTAAKQSTRRLTSQTQAPRVQPQPRSQRQPAAPEILPAAQPASRQNRG